MNDISLPPLIPNANPETNTYSADLTCAWALEAHKIIVATEIAESDLSYSSKCKSEGMRKLAGAYYTPADVADHFWLIFFERRGISTPRVARKLLESSLFVEPSVGAGVLFFSLLKGLIHRGLSPDILCTINADLIDINPQALEFVGHQIERLEQCWQVKFDGVNLINGDFCTYSLRNLDRTPIFFGNPPFVANEKGTSKWKNLYADFVERSLELSHCPSHLHYILPLSIAFSRDYRELRSILRNLSFEIAISSYDNIPDTLFKSGKPKHTNTNKANSQRCSILTAIPSNSSRLLASRLHRWNKAERASILSSVPTFHDVSQYKLDDQIPRPTSHLIADYLQSSSGAKRLGMLIGGWSRYQLVVASVARNYIGFRDAADSSSNVLVFGNEEDFLTALGIISSRLFFEYWLSVGDGFHLTKSNIWNFPISTNVEEQVRFYRGDIRKFWNFRKHFEKTKLNHGKITRSFDFSDVAPTLLFENIET